MAKEIWRAKDLEALGIKDSSIISMMLEALRRHYKHTEMSVQRQDVKSLIANPETFENDEVWSKVAQKLILQQNELQKIKQSETPLRPQPVPYHIFGKKQIEQGAIQQMEAAALLPISVAGALMPDAHQGYGLPIGGVLATVGGIIPYAVGVDIGCRMALSILDLPASYLAAHRSILKQTLGSETKFGTGGNWKKPHEDAVLDNPLFEEIALLRNLRQKAALQIGTSGSGNHFVEFGILEISEIQNDWDLPIGSYIGLLSHSGSRGLGATIATHYTRIATETCLLPKSVRHLSWLDLNKQEGQEYWLAMNLAGEYAAACHHWIHKKVAKSLGCNILATIENHHNFAWKEEHEGQEVMVHRKGATPAGAGVLGIIPGSMASPGYVVKGKGNPLSLSSASHGAGRLMSRKEATQSITKKMLQQILQQKEVDLIGGSLDESPMAYKNIEQVMSYQEDLVEVVGIFHPKIVRMDG